MALASIPSSLVLSAADINPATDVLAAVVLATVMSASGNVITLVCDDVIPPASNLIFLEVSEGSTTYKFSSLILIGSVCVPALNVSEILSMSSPPK